MARNSTLARLDELEKVTQDFLAELTDMESKRGGSFKKRNAIGQTDMTDSPADKGAPLSDGPDDGEVYCMKNPRRGECLIFVYKNFLNPQHDERSSALKDSEVCQDAFKALNFEVQVFENLKTKDLQAELEKASSRNHRDCDAFAVVFMSHGVFYEGREKLVTYDGTIYTEELWRSIAQCSSLQGKPKFFFIQACRGCDAEPSVGLKVSTDGPSLPEPVAERTLEFDSPDMLVMQSSYTRMVSFRTARNNIEGSVFIHFLAQILKEKGRQKYLSELLLEVTRRVALDYEAIMSQTVYDKAKQMPVTRSTLDKKIRFPEA